MKLFLIEWQPKELLKMTGYNQSNNRYCKVYAETPNKAIKTFVGEDKWVKVLGVYQMV